MNQRQRVRQLETALENRSLVYFGTRGADARSLLGIRQFETLFSQIAPLDAVSVRETCLESLTGLRVDLDSYSIDADRSAAVAQMRAGLLRAFSRPAAALAYRPTALLASAWFPRADHVLFLANFHEWQACFEHKPWVESQLASRGVRVVPWRYCCDEDRSLVFEAAESGPIVLRTNRSDGGAGLRLVRRVEELAPLWPEHTDGFLAFARFLHPTVPLNVNGCVFRDGSVSLHGPSLQLLGLPLCTDLPFGYCGNDFGAAASLDSRVLDDFEQMATMVGAWLASNGYVGAFGIDALLHEDRVFLAEVNPRFQGSSRLAASIDQELDRPDVFMNHIAAFLGLPPPPRIPLHELSRSGKPRAHVVCHNRAKQPAPAVVLALPPHVDVDLIPASGTLVAPGGILFDVVFHEVVSRVGTSLLPSAERLLAVAMGSNEDLEPAGL